MAKVTIQGILVDGTKIGIANLLPVCVNYLLFVLTCWIPYLNVGTFIGIQSLPAKMSRNEQLSYTEIFNPVYRKYMGEGFLTTSFITSGVVTGFIFLIIPGIVIAIAWSLALLLVFDKNMDPIAAIKKSNDLTYGNKLMIAVGKFVYYIALGFVIGILTKIPMPTFLLTFLFILAIGVVAFSLLAGVNAYIYKKLAN